MNIRRNAIVIASALLVSTQAHATWRVEQSTNKYTGEEVVRMADYSSKSVWLDCTSLTSTRLTIEFPGYLRREGLGKILWTTGEEHGTLEMNEHNLDSWIALQSTSHNSSKSDVSLYSELNSAEEKRSERLIMTMRTAEQIEFKTEGYQGTEYHQVANLDGFDEAWNAFSSACQKAHSTSE